MARNMLDYINMMIEKEQSPDITLEEFTRIRNSGTPEEIAEAVERMEAAGGYDNLE